jgi:hypothetical protein
LLANLGLITLKLLYVFFSYGYALRPSLVIFQTGFEFRKRKATPIVTGIVVAAENETALLEVLNSSLFLQSTINIFS